MIPALATLFGLYLFCMVALMIGFRKIKTFSLKTPLEKTSFTIIIPFRNESENLDALLKSIFSLNYPLYLFEVLLVNDNSSDSSEEIIKEMIEKRKISFQLLQNNRVSNSPKKDAISEAIKTSKFEWLVTTDADCELPKNWLKTLDAFIQTEQLTGNINAPVMICGPVLYKTNGSFLQDFQQLDGFSLQAATIGSFGLKTPILSNGANLAYRKDSFEQVGGFSGNDHIASGDDIFLMEKMNKSFPGKVRFLKSPQALVSTKPQASWKDLVNQRIRWASKTSKQKNRFSILLGGLVFLVNLAFLVLPVAIIIDFWNFEFYIILIVLKILMDYVVVLQSAKFFGKPISILKFPALSIVYATLILIVFVKSLGGKYSWKGRTFQNRI